MPVFPTRVNQLVFVATIGGTALIAGSASAQQAHFAIQVNNASNSINYNGGFDQTGNFVGGQNYNFVGQLTDPNNFFSPDWAIEWNFNGDPNAGSSTSSIGNNWTIRNQSDTETLTFTITVMLDLTNPSTGPITAYGGGVGFTLNTSGPGALSAPGSDPSRALWTPLINGNEFENLWTPGLDTAALFEAPFLTSTTGSGSISIPSRNFNQPGVTYWGPAATTSIGVMFDVVLTPDDYITATGTFGIQGTVPAPGALALLGLSGLVGRSRRRSA
jgi:hypothetical protein